MFAPGSRYEKMPTYTVTLSDGRQVSAVRLPPRTNDPLVGLHRRLEGQRIDHIAAHYLGDPTTFWRLCDVSNAMVPDALANRDLVGVPRKAR